jgi:dihydrofolate reductase
MAKLIYSAIASVDGHVADSRGGFDWAAPDVEVHRSINDLMRPIGTHLYGRRLYEVMQAWASPDLLTDPAPAVRDFAEIWQAADKVVYSTTMAVPAAERTRLESAFDPARVGDLKAAASADLLIGGADLGGQAIAAGLVDELHLYLVPMLVGGGTPALPVDVRLPIALLDQQRFDNGTVHLHYAVQNPV